MKISYTKMILIAGLIFLHPGIGYAADNPVTTSDPAISLDDLGLKLMPLTKDELAVEAEAWRNLVRTQVETITQGELTLNASETAKEIIEEAVAAEEQVSTDEEIPPLPDTEELAKEVLEDEEKEDQLVDLVELKNQRVALVERLRLVITHWEEKGGDPEEYRLYADAVSEIVVDTSDWDAFLIQSKSWLVSKEGGQRWLTNFLKFVGTILGFYAIAFVAGIITDRAMGISGNVSYLMREFVRKSIKRLIILIGIVVALSALQFNVGPMLAAIGAAGFVVAFALQDSLSNLASGIMILLYKPFDVGDSVEMADVAGKVSSMNLVSTTINTFDNKKIIIPNNSVWGGVIINATSSATRRVDMVFGIGYGDDEKKALEIIKEVTSGHEKVLSNPELVVQLHELADSSVNFICRPWVKTDDYWTVYWDITRLIKEAFDKEGINIPFPQMDVHIHQNKDS